MNLRPILPTLGSHDNISHLFKDLSQPGIIHFLPTATESLPWGSNVAPSLTTLEPQQRPLRLSSVTRVGGGGAEAS